MCCDQSLLQPFLPLQVVRYSPKILTLDLADSASLADKCQEAVGFYGRVDILVNNAGVSSRGTVLDTEMATDRKVMEVNFFGTVGLTKGERVRQRGVLSCF